MPSQAVAAFWRTYTEAHDTYDVWHFADTEPVARHLLDLVLAGKKTATCGLLWEMETPNNPMPIDGGYSVLTDFAGTPHAIIQTIELRTLPFGSIDEAFALAEGEGTYAQWRTLHWDYFTRRCEVLGRTCSEDMPVLCERFALRFPGPA